GGGAGAGRRGQRTGHLRLVAAAGGDFVPPSAGGTGRPVPAVRGVAFRQPCAPGRLAGGDAAGDRSP
ncbi:hypothetical protein AZZ98_003989, partial [Serratia marcescens]